MATKKTTTKKTTAKKTTTKKPQARKWYILANGEGTRWGNYKGVSKQLIEIEGETLLNRMTRLLKENGVAKNDIIICGQYDTPNSSSIMTKSKTKREVFEEIAELAQGPFGILYGDCYYTDAIIKELTTRPVKKFDEFFSLRPKS